MELSSRLNRVKESGTFKIIDKVRALQAQGRRIIQLDVGEPDFNTPSQIIEAAHSAMLSGYTHYTPSMGLPELRDAIVQKLKAENGLDYRREEVIITPGSKQALFYAIMALVDDGDEVIVPTPAWPSYMEMVSLAGGSCVEVKPSSGFKPDIDAIRGSITSKTKAIMINSPNNPTGYVCDRRELSALAEIADEAGIVVISDEIYEKILYEGEAPSIASLARPDAKIITINGFSKTYAMTGWRIGYAAGPREIIAAMNKMQQHSASCAASFVQKAAAEALRNDSGVSEMIKEFKRRRDFMCDTLLKLGHFKLEKPRGAFYLFPDISETGMKSEELCNLLLEKGGVSTTPGEVFGGYSSNIRISYANSMENLEDAVSKIGEVLEKK